MTRTRKNPDPSVSGTGMSGYGYGSVIFTRGLPGIFTRPKRCHTHRLGPLGRRWQAYVACLLSLWVWHKAGTAMAANEKFKTQLTLPMKNPHPALHLQTKGWGRHRRHR